MNGGTHQITPANPLIELAGVTKVYGQGQAALHALQGLDLLRLAVQVQEPAQRAEDEAEAHVE